MEVWKGGGEVGGRRGHLCLHNMGSRDGAVLRGLASYHCGLGSIPGPDVTCGLGLLLEDFFPFLHKNQHFQFQFGLATVDKKNRLMSTTKSHIFYQDWETVRCKYLFLIFIVDYLWLMVTRQLIKFQSCCSPT